MEVLDKAGLSFFKSLINRFFATKSYVNKAISSSSGKFWGTFNDLADLQAIIGSNGDYAYVIVAEDYNTSYDRYKWQDTDWVFEYNIGSEEFDAEQWAAINSGLSSADKTKLDEISANIGSNRISDMRSDIDANASEIELINQNKQDKLTFDTTPTEGSTNPVTSGGVKEMFDLLPIELFAYGVEFDSEVSSPVLTRVGRSDYHATLPVQSLMRRCLLNDNGEVVAYLDANDSTLTEAGETADLTGASGMVMVEIPEHYRKFEFNGTKTTVLISLIPLQGFHKVRKIYRSAYEASLQRSTLKLASVANTTADFRGGNNTAGWDDTYRSLLGRPATSFSLTNFRKYARNRGTAGLNGKGWNCDLYEAQLNTFWLYVIEYANLNCQAAFTSELTEQGYHKGGLGSGVTTLDSTKLNNFNGYNPFIPCGITNSLGNRTGVVDYDMPEEYNATTVTVHVPCYRGIENPFGHVWSWTDGLHVQVQSDAAGGSSIFYRAIDDDPANFQDSNYNGYETRGELPRANGYVTKILCGEFGDNLPLAAGGTGAGSTSFFCDNFYTIVPESGVSLRGVYFGGDAVRSAYAGLACANASYAPSFTHSYLGSRLCFIPAA